jgi:hypothetical protein
MGEITTVISEATLQAIVEAGETGGAIVLRNDVVEMAQELLALRAEAYEQATEKSDMYHRLVETQAELAEWKKPATKPQTEMSARHADCPKCHGYGRIMDGVISSQSYPCPVCQSTVPLRSTAGAARHADALCDGRWG